MKKIFTLSLLLYNIALFAQVNSHVTLSWSENDLSFENATHTNRLPYFNEIFDVQSRGHIIAEIINPVYAPFNSTNQENFDLISKQIDINSWIEQERQSFIGKISFIPIRKKGNIYEKLISFDLSYKFEPSKNTIQSRGPGNTYTSVLSSGDVFKIGVSSQGIHQLDFNYLKNSLGINVENLNPKTIKIYGAGGVILPHTVGKPRIDDLVEIPILVQGESDGKFNENDKVLFFAENTKTWTYDLQKKKYTHHTNPYDDFNYYFLKIGGDMGIRVKNAVAQTNPSYTTEEGDALFHFEEDKYNFLSDKSSTHGSGTKWFGDKFGELNNKKSYPDFVIPDLITSDSVRLVVDFLGRSNLSNQFQVSTNGQTFVSNSFSPINDLSDIEITLAYVKTMDIKFKANSNNININLEYPLRNGTSIGMLDFISLIGRQKLNLRGNQSIFRDSRSFGKGIIQFKIGNTNNNSLTWDVSDKMKPFQMQTQLAGKSTSFNILSESLNTFVVFDKNANFSTPVFGVKIENQNIHKLRDVELVIITHPLFWNEANELAKHRRNHDKFKVEVVNVGHVYNEFASGRREPTAIRDFVKMIADRNENFKYVLLFGDGSFDFRNIENAANPKNFIPVFETDSFFPLHSYPSDDFFGLISDGEGAKLKGAIDLAVGRLTVSTVSEAKNVVKKLINYDLNYESFGNWRNRMIFVADDEDSNNHLNPVETISQKIDTTQSFINKEKIYFDAFEQISTSGGEKFPDATNAINKNIFKGGLTINYMGHGGPTGWAQERVLRLRDIDGWKNKNNLPLFVTATCSFTSFDDYTIVSPGERILLNKNGGGIGLFTTVRAVYLSSNTVLTKAVFNSIFDKKSNGKRLRIGEMLSFAKNRSNVGENSRKFLLIGDPSMRLAFPKFDVVTTSFNNQSITQTDTIGAFEKVTLTGEIQNNGQILANFNGTVAVTVFDKPAELKTLGQDEKSQVTSFQLQKNIIFNGMVSAKNGKFSCEFIVPKDINYSYGHGKISYYAWNRDLVDATGVFSNFIVGGTSGNSNIDDQPPVVEVFMNDENFVFGGVTDQNPILFVKLKDDFGINLTGSSVGHNLTGVLDDNTSNIYQLNDFYTGEIDDYTAGAVRFPLFDIKPGRHKLKVTAWDIANNSADGYTEFVVANSEKMALEHVLNYPNPFTTHTDFQFEHNYPGQMVKVQIRIFSVSGKLVKTIDQEIMSDSYRIDNIAWNGDDEFGSPLARGVYLYKIKIGVDNGGGKQKSTESDFEKLVILK